MDKKIYDEGLAISKNFEKRPAKDTQRLYDIIIIAIKEYNKSAGRGRDLALSFLTMIYEPLLKKTSSRLYNNLKNTHDYTDILQETHTMFYTLLKRYDPERSAFSYYINVMLPQHMNRWAEREVLHNRVNAPVNTEDFPMVDPIYNSSDAVHDHLNAFVLTHEYQDFIKQRALRHSRSKTVSEVCNRFFLGSDTCSEISKDLGISYHAVYEIIGKIKKEIQIFFQINAFSGCVVTSTGITLKVIDYE